MYKKIRFIYPVLIFCISLGLLLVSIPSNATVITYELEAEFSYGTPPEGPIPWLIASFDDSVGGDNTVRLTMSAINLTDEEFVSEWYFNFDPDLDSTLLTFSVVGNNSASIPNGIYTGNDLYKADGDGLYDILFDFPPPNEEEISSTTFDQRFTAGETVIYDIRYNDSKITADSFNFLSTPDGGHGPYPTAAHVQGIGDTDDDSGWVTVPEPSIMILLGSLLIGLGLVGIKRKPEV